VWGGGGEAVPFFFIGFLVPIGAIVLVDTQIDIHF
jgi:hypothetical protein